MGKTSTSQIAGIVPAASHTCGNNDRHILSNRMCGIFENGNQQQRIVI